MQQVHRIIGKQLVDKKTIQIFIMGPYRVSNRLKTPILASVNGLMYAKLLIVFVKLVNIYMIHKMNTYSCVVERQSLYV